jgi:hypothetical protein
MSRRGLLAALAAAAIAVLPALTADQALAGIVHCGDLITQDTTLDSDLLGCPSPALTIAGDDVSLDLNGHIVDGGITTSRSRLPYPPGSSVVVENGTLENGGLSLSSYESATVRDLTSTGMVVVYSSRVLVERSFVGSGGMAFANNAGADVEVRVIDNVIRGAGVGVGVGFFQGAGPGLVAGNRITQNGAGIDMSHQGGLITLVGNTVRGNGTGIGAGQGGRFTATHNVVTDNGDGISLDEAAATLERNVISRNERNGIEVGLANLNADHNVISQNGIDGIVAGHAVRGTLANNSLDRNGNDGIRVTEFDPLLTLTDNHTWFNGNLGIDAPPGTLGSDNWAKHNGDPAQCAPASLCITKGKPKKQ